MRDHLALIAEVSFLFHEVSLMLLIDDRADTGKLDHNAECVYRTTDKPRRMVYSTELVIPFTCKIH